MVGGGHDDDDGAIDWQTPPDDARGWDELASATTRTDALRAMESRLAAQSAALTATLQSHLASEAAHQQARDEAIEAAFVGLVRRIDAANSERAAQVATLRDLEARLGEHQAATAEMASQLPRLASQVASMTSRLDESLGAQRKRLEAIATSVAGLAAAPTPKAPALEEELGHLAAVVADLRDQPLPLAAEIAALQAQVADAVDRWPAASSELAALRARVDDLCERPLLADEINALSRHVGELVARPAVPTSTTERSIGGAASTAALAALQARMEELLAPLADAGARERPAAMVPSPPSEPGPDGASAPWWHRLSAAVEDLRTAHRDPGPSFTFVHDRLDALFAAVDGLRREVAAPTAESEAVTEAVAGRDRPRPATETTDLVAYQPPPAPVGAEGGTGATGAQEYDLDELRRAVAAVHDDRAELAEHLDRLALEVHESRQRRPELTSSLQAIASLVESQGSAAADLRFRLVALAELAHRLDVTAGRTESALAPLSVGLDSLAGRFEAIESRITEAVAALGDQVDASGPQREEAVRTVIDQIRAGNDRVEDSLIALAAQTRAIDGRIDGALAAVIDSNEQSTTALADTVERLAARTVGAEPSELDELVAELRADRSRPGVDPEAVSTAVLAPISGVVARIERRLDGEFDTVGWHVEALGALLVQLVDAVHRLEAEMLGAQPGAEQLLGAAADMVERLRARARPAEGPETDPDESGRSADGA
ncbi:MAG: hypothetical protein ACT4PW_13505 [Acidimicrobiia bacterium]